MSDTVANETLARRWHMEMFQEGKLDVADEILAPGFYAIADGRAAPGAGDPSGTSLRATGMPTSNGYEKS